MDVEMRIDVHSHFIPRKAIEKLGNLGIEIKEQGGGEYALLIKGSPVGPFPKGAFDVEDRVREMDLLGLDVQVISPTHHLFFYGADVKLARVVARVQNEGIAEAVKRSDGRLVGNATIPLQDKDAALEELKYAVEELGLKGIEIGTNVAGKNLDDESLFPIYELAEELELPIFVHPNDIMSPERHKRYYSSIVVGTLAETTLAITSIIFGGVLDRFPRLKLIFSHGGASVPFQAGRLEHASIVRNECKGIKRKVADYLRMIYYDSVLFKREALEYLVREVTADQVLLGTDYPFNMGDFYSYNLVKNLSKEDQKKILYENAKRLYRI